MDKDIITESINDFLLQYENIKKFAQINVEELPDSSDSLALQRTGVERLAPRYIGEQYFRKQYQYMLLIKLDSEDNEQRKKALNWLDKLGKWIETNKIKRNFPTTENRVFYDMGCSNELSYETDSESKVTIYYIQLYFNVKEGN